MKKLILATLLACIALSGCSNTSASVDTLVKSGYTDIHIRGYSPFTCSDSDTYSTGFTAKNPGGLEVKGVVCCGLLKSCTVRF